jgi:integrase
VTTLHQHLQDYLALRRAMGFKMDRHAYLLGQFVDYLTARDVATLSTEHAMDWACSPSSATARWWGARLSIARGFAVYLNGLDPAHQIPPRGVLPQQSRRVVPYLYTDTEVTALIQAAEVLWIPLRVATYQTLTGLLAATGMRIGEAIASDRDDLDVEAGVLTVRNGKFGKSRQLPLHPSTRARLGEYLDLCDRLCPHPATTALLLSTRGYRLRYPRVWRTFHRMTCQAELAPHSPECRPRIHDLRH